MMMEKTTTEGLSILSPIAVKKNELTEWAKTADALVVTKETLAEADKVRLKGKNYRLEVQKVVKGNIGALNKIKDEQWALEKEFVDIVEPAEKRLEAKIKAIKDEEERLKREALQKEENRKRDIQSRIKALTARSGEVRACPSLEELDAIEKSVALERDNFQEFNEEGNAVIDLLEDAIKARRIKLQEPKEEIQFTQPTDDKALEGNSTSWIQQDEIGVTGNSGGKVWETTAHKTASKMTLPDTVIATQIQMNTITIKGFSFGIDKRIGLDGVSAIREAIEKILS